MADYTDLVLRYARGEMARLVFDGGAQTIAWPVQDESPVVPPEPIPGPGPTVSTSAELTSALIGGAPVITMAAGTYTGNFRVTAPCVLTGSGASTCVLTPSDITANVLSVLASDVACSAFAVQLGLANRTAVEVGTTTATSVAAQPNRVSFTDVDVRATATGGHRGFGLHGSNITLLRVNVTGFLEQNRDSQAVWICNGPGPYTVRNSYLEASGENIMLGGAVITIPGCVPSDVLISGCTLFKQQAWRSKPGSVKNSFEVKAGKRVRFENNTIDGCWLDAQAGNVIVLTPKPEGTNPWVIVDDIVVVGNVIKHTTDGFGVNISGKYDQAPSLQTQRITIDHNLFQDVPKGIQVVRGVSVLLSVTNNTLPALGHSLLNFDGVSGGVVTNGVYTPMTITNNVFESGTYGAKGTGTGAGTATLQFWSNGAYTMVGNVIEQEASITWPAANQLLANGALTPLLDPVTFKYLPDPSKGY